MQADAAQWYANNVAVWALGVSALSLAVSGLSVTYSRRQAIAARDQVEEARNARMVAERALQAEQTESQNTAALSLRTAEAAEESAKAAEAAVQLGRRAWVTIDVVEGGERDNFQVPRSVEVSILNSGTTPAFSVLAQTWLRSFAEPNPQFPLHDSAFVRLDDLGSNCRKKLFARATSDEVERRRILDGNIKLYCYGELKYVDAFDADHAIQWCHVYLPVIQRFHPIDQPERSRRKA